MAPKGTRPRASGVQAAAGDKPITLAYVPHGATEVCSGHSVTWRLDPAYESYMWQHGLVPCRVAGREELMEMYATKDRSMKRGKTAKVKPCAID